ncbi:MULTISPECIES: ATP-binding protein [Myxococcus]|nr:MULTISPECIES: ATP-binding protein [Myxococcus]NOJ56116.1 ATP-binding protein [Myxococcus xanthus]QPM79982.1 ATP-binding protein [Myxococcus xanthus]QVW69046.1 ATP-binding protein [Myxococcus xanthus DZ2]QZZ47818.1 hypothetical protein MyxoNM_01280 [Myxococcus xanthus]UEO04826.1 ATP-binding protein [Myxococcus xanthus DZ2]
MRGERPILLAEGDLPRLDGHEVLRRIRADARTRMLPVVILSASAEEAVAARGPQGRVQVADRGSGISEDLVKHVFERFGRALSSRADGGRAWAGPREGGGARFTLDLPLEKERRE